MNTTIFSKDTLKDYLGIIIGSFLTAIAINVFLVPYKIEPGGVSGISTVIYYLSNQRMPIGLTSLCFNIPLFIAGFKLIGKNFAIRTLFSIVLLSFFIDSTTAYSQYFAHTYLSTLENATNFQDYLLYSIFGGLVMGLGLGIVFRCDSTTGGTDILAMIINHFRPNFTVGQALLMIETCIVIFATISFQSFLLGLYAIVALFIQSKVIDAVLEGVNFARAVIIISDNSDAISKKILYEIERGVTALKGVGMYTGVEKHVLLCVVQRGQIPSIKEIVKELDKSAFIILTDVREVFGEGFKKYK